MEITKKQTVEQYRISEKLEGYEAVVLLTINRDTKTYSITPPKSAVFRFCGAGENTDKNWWAVLQCIDKAINIANKELFNIL